MAKLLKLRRGTNTQHTTFTGAEGEVTVNTTNDSLHVHDGSTAGGTELAKADLSNVDGSLSNNLGFGDNVKATFGASNDLEIYHDGASSYIKDAGTGALYLQSDEIRFINSAGNENLTILNENGAATLYHDNAAKLATTSGGIDVTGAVTCDGITSDGSVTISASSPQLVIQDSDNTGSTAYGNVVFRDSANAGKWLVGDFSTSSEDVYLYNFATADVVLSTNNDGKEVKLTTAGHWVPGSDDSQDLGTSSLQWRNGYFDGTVNCDGLHCEGDALIDSTTGTLQLKDSDSTGNSVVNYVQGIASNNSGRWYVGQASTSNQWCYLSNQVDAPIVFETNGDIRAAIQNNGHFVPWANNTYDLGTSTLRWRNVYTNDLNLSNEGGANDVDGTWGSWTIQEGEDELFLLNRRNGKKYKFNLSEVN